ncbi:MAG: hypothetical protein P8X42_02720 [Calditrichaceae bacterium]
MTGALCVLFNAIAYFIRMQITSNFPEGTDYRKHKSISYSE